MPVSVPSSVSGPFTPNGVTTEFSFAFKADQPSDVIVVDQVGLALSTALFSVTLDDDEGGSVTFSVAPSAGDYDELYIINNPELTQLADFSNTGSSFNPASLTRALDRAAIRDLKLQRELDRTIRMPFGEEGQVLPARSELVGKFLVGNPQGELVPASGTGADSAMRADLASSDSDKGAALIALAQGGVVADAIKWVTPQMFGAVGDGVADDYMAFADARDAGQYIFIPPGRYRLSTPLVVHDGQVFSGAGKSAWGPYSAGGSPFPSVYRTEIIVDGHTAFDARNANAASVRGLAIKSAAGTQSSYGAPAGFQAGAVGIDISGSEQFEASDISFHGLETGILANPGAETVTQMPTIDDWAASDCGTVFRFGTSSSTNYTVRDPRISDCTIALHCDRMIEAHWCDGFRLENVRLFQSYAKSVHIRATPFVSFDGVTIFETAEEQVMLEDCQYITLSGLSLARAGGYQTATPYPQKTALTLDGCTDVHASGQIQQPTGVAVQITGCSNVSLNLAIGTPFWTTGNATNASGAINVSTSDGVSINGSFGGAGHWVNVYADLQSSRTLTGAVAGDASTGVVRVPHIQQKGGHIIRQDAAVGPISAEGSSSFYTLRVWVPAGKVLKTRCVEMTSPGIVLRASGVFWTGSVAEGGGSVSLEDKVLYDNSAGPDGWYSIDLMFYNPTTSDITVPAGHETRISTALV